MHLCDTLSPSRDRPQATTPHHRGKMRACRTACTPTQAAALHPGQPALECNQVLPRRAPGDGEYRCDENDIRLTVQDQGIGIPEADRAHLFEAFYRARECGQHAGHRLGLAIVKQSVELHGGRDHLRERGGGRDDVSRSSFLKARSPRRGHVKRVLVIEDEEHLRSDLITVLGFEGYEAIGLKTAAGRPDGTTAPAGF